MPFNLAPMALVLALSFTPPGDSSPGATACRCQKAQPLAEPIATQAGCDAASDSARPAVTLTGAGVLAALAPVADARVWISIDGDAVVISRQKEFPAGIRKRLADDALLVRCREVRSEMAAQGGPTAVKLVCRDAEFFTGRGMKGRAARLVYDSSAGMLELGGGDGHHVQIVWRRPGGAADMQIVAQDVQFDVKRSWFRLSHAPDFLKRPAACCCGSDCPCVQAGCSSKSMDAPSPIGIEATPLPASEDRRIFTFSVGFTR